MGGNRTLMAYFSKGGVTEDYAILIADTLRENYDLEVDISQPEERTVT